MKQKIKAFLQFFTNPRLLLCLAVAWMITNGWSYVVLGMGTFFKINWMIAVGSAYMAILWFPFSPEKLLTVAIAVALLRWLFPNDQKTLAVLYEMREKAKQAIRKRKNKKKAEEQTRK